MFTVNGGSEDDEAVLNLGRYIRKVGLDTHLIEGGVIASGGVSLFLAGTKRSIGKDALVGVHSWQHCSNRNLPCRTATEFTHSVSAHDLHKNYIVDMLSVDRFYWFSINTAAHDSIHWITEQELMLYQVKNSTLNKEIHIPFPGAFKAEYEKVCHNCPVKKG